MKFQNFIHYQLIDKWNIQIEVLQVLQLVATILFFQLFHWGLRRLIIQQKKFHHIDSTQAKVLKSYFRHILQFFTLLICLNILGVPIKSWLEFNLINLYNIKITAFHILGIFVIIAAARFLLWTFKKLIIQQERAKKIDVGKGFAFYKISKYIMIVITVALILETIGIKITILLAGSAALLVGLGLGIQQIFNDVISGVFLLFEGTVSVHDIIEINGLVGEVKHIDIRTSKIVSRDNIMIIVPNSKLISDNVINWTLNKEDTRFKIKVGVAYGSDTEMVRNVLLVIADNHPDITNVHKPIVRFDDFGSSSLNFTLLFWSKRMFDVEELKSDLRFEIDKRFREGNISIPFPQRDLHIKSTNTVFPVQPPNQ